MADLERRMTHREQGGHPVPACIHANRTGPVLRDTWRAEGGPLIATVCYAGAGGRYAGKVSAQKHAKATQAG